MKRSLVFALVILALVVSACGAPQATPAEADQPAPAGEKVSLRLWSHQNPAFSAGNQAIIDKFMQENPNIEVTYETFEYDAYITTLQTSMEAGTEADVLELFGTWVCSYANGGRLMPVPENVMTYAQAQELFYKAPLDGYYCGGKLYGFPHESNLENGGVLVNPALFEAHGVAYPPQWQTFADVIADAKKLTEFDGEVMTKAGFHFVTGDGLPFTLLAGILQQGGSYFAEDGKHFNFTSPEAKQTAQLLIDLVQKDKVVDPVLFNSESNWVGDSFFAGNVAIGFVGSWAAGNGLVDYPDVKFDYVAIPPYFGTENLYAADAGWGKVVATHTKHPVEAWKLAQYMTVNAENALTYNVASTTIPALKSLVEKPDQLLAKTPYLKAVFPLLDKGEFIGDVTDRDLLFYEIIYIHLLSALQGNISIDEALDLINNEANAMVDAK